MPVPIGHKRESHNRLALPGTLPGKDRCVKVWIPNDRRYNDYLIGALNRLATWIVYEPDDEHTAALVAQEWKRANSRTFSTLGIPCHPSTPNLPVWLSLSECGVVIDACQSDEDICVDFVGVDIPAPADFCIPSVPSPTSEADGANPQGGKTYLERVGEVKMHCLGVLPENWLPLTGGVYSADDYPALYDIMPENLKDTPVEGQFTLPDFSQRMLMGAAAGNPFGAQGGNRYITLSENQMPTHNHEPLNHSHAYLRSVSKNIQQGSGAFVSVGAPATDSTLTNTVSNSLQIDNSGGGEAIDILNPFTQVHLAIVAREA